MAVYPGMPDNRLIVNGVDLTDAYGLILVDGYKLNPPTPKTYTIDIPGSDGVIDLTESLTGDVAYNNRSMEFTFYLIEPQNFELVKTNVSNFLHGKAFDYRITMDPEYTYHGRFSVTSYDHQADPYLAHIVISIDADPYKKLDTLTYRVNAAGGVKLTFSSGRKPVRPVFEVNQEALVAANGITKHLQRGTWRLNDLWFHEGNNVVYINTYFGDGDVPISTYADDVISSQENTIISDLLWSDVARASLTINDWKDDIVKTHYSQSVLETVYSQSTDKPEYLVYVQYDWKDL